MTDPVGFGSVKSKTGGLVSGVCGFGGSTSAGVGGFGGITDPMKPLPPDVG